MVVAESKITMINVILETDFYQGEIKKDLSVLPIIVELKLRKERLGSFEFKKTLIADAVKGRLRGKSANMELALDDA